MSQQSDIPAPDGPGPAPRPDPADIASDDWVARRVPRAARPYVRLMRLDRPIGTWLLLFPCWWSIVLAMAADGGDSAATGPDMLPALPALFALFGIGAVVMRGAGCVYNDIIDRHFDGRVARTRTRPIPSGQVSVARALVFLGCLLGAGLVVLIQLDRAAILLGIASLVLVFTYPLMKRVTYWPQLVLGLAFNWGALMGYAAVRGTLAPEAALLYLGGIFWTLGYDTIYAHQDADDDALIGVKSLALKLGARTRPWLAGFYAAAIGAFALAGMAAGLGPLFYAGLGAAAAHLAWQWRMLDIADPAICLRLFRANRDFGALMLVALVLGWIG